VVETCRWASIKKHWKEAGINEGRELACDTDSVRCYVLRYRNLFEGACALRGDYPLSVVCPKASPLSSPCPSPVLTRPPVSTPALMT
jgi:hypothetical protein